jgi:hypothetical protein
MIKVSIFLDEVLTNQAQFPSQEEAEAWVAYHNFSNPVYEDVTINIQADATRQARIAAGAAARQACQNVLDLIAGINLEQELTLEQISLMQQNFELAERALRAGRPSLAKGAIQLITPDGVIVTQEMKDEALALLAAY